MKAPTRPRAVLTAFNLALTLTLMVCLVMEVMPLSVLFVLGFTIALLVNHPRWDAQQALLERHSKSVVLVATMTFAGGIFTGILTGTKMINEMSQTLIEIIPDSLGGHLPILVAITAMPLSLVFTPSAFYFGMLPVIATTAASLAPAASAEAEPAALPADPFFSYDRPAEYGVHTTRVSVPLRDWLKRG